MMVLITKVIIIIIFIKIAIMFWGFDLDNIEKLTEIIILKLFKIHRVFAVFKLEGLGVDGSHFLRTAQILNMAGDE